MFVDGSGNLWIADTFNSRIREVVAGTINTVVGNGVVGSGGDGGLPFQLSSTPRMPQSLMGREICSFLTTTRNDCAR